MKSIFVVALILFISSDQSWAKKNTLIESKLSVGSKDWVISVETKPSKPNSNGQGFCGVGEEVNLIIRQTDSPKIVFSKLIESCLQSIELLDGQLGSENAKSLSHAVQIKKNPIEIRWLSIGDKTNVFGKVDLSTNPILYSEENLKNR